MRKRGIYGRDIVDASVVFRVPSNLFRFFVFFSSFLSSLGDLGNRLSFPRFFLSAPLLRILSKRACYVLEIWDTDCKIENLYTMERRLYDRETVRYTILTQCTIVWGGSGREFISGSGSGSRKYLLRDCSQNFQILLTSKVEIFENWITFFFFF